MADIVTSKVPEKILPNLRIRVHDTSEEVDVETLDGVTDDVNNNPWQIPQQESERSHKANEKLPKYDLQSSQTQSLTSSSVGPTNSAEVIVISSSEE